MAEKERFELSRRYNRPTPLAGAPLRPLEYFSVYPSAGCRFLLPAYPLIIHNFFRFVNTFFTFLLICFLNFFGIFAEMNFQGECRVNFQGECKVNFAVEFSLITSRLQRTAGVFLGEVLDIFLFYATTKGAFQPPRCGCFADEQNFDDST